MSASTERGLQTIAFRGSLCALSRFDDAVYMTPTVNAAQLSVRDTGLETRFVAAMAEDLGETEAASLFRLTNRAVKRAIEFEDAVA